ncbi:MAG: polysaccharide pyruvyl transferase family protein [Ardenticatenaceae bacterium]
MNILILNLHSALNLGDDAIMSETLRGVRELYPKATITAAANDPASWQKYDKINVVGSLATWVVERKEEEWRWRKVLFVLYAGLLAMAAVVYRISRVRIRFGNRQQRALLNAYYDADLVLSCGGGNFYAHGSLSIALFCSLLTLAFAKALGKKLIMLPQSIGPISGHLQQVIAKMVFNRVDRILVREHKSVDFLRNIGVRQPVHLLPDLAFGFPSQDDQDDRTSLGIEASDTLRIGVTVMDRGAQEKQFGGQQGYERALESVLLRLNQERQAHIYLFVQCYGPTPDQDDRLCTRRLYERLKQQVSTLTLLDSFSSASELKRAYKQMDCIIGTRMHTGIFALTKCVPVVLIAYQPKAFGVMKSFGLERFCSSIEEVRESELYDQLQEVLNHRSQLQKYISQRYADQGARLQGWARHLQD